MCFLFSSPNERVSLVLEYPDLLNATEVRERLLEELLGEPVGDPSTVDRAVGGAGLIVHFVKGQGFGIHWKKRKEKKNGDEIQILALFNNWCWSR